jgi:putative ABC transport system permease protein
MLAFRDNLALSAQAIRAHKLRATLTMLGLTMGVATLITVMTLVQGANQYVEQKIANLGTNVFQIGRVPFAVADLTKILKALRNKNITVEDMQAVADRCGACRHVGGEASTTVSSRFRDRDLENTRLVGQTSGMVDVDTRTILQGRYFTPQEDARGAQVALVGASVAEELFAGLDPVGRTMRLGTKEFTVIGTYEKLGSVLGQDQDNFAVIPMGSYQRVRGNRFSLVIHVQAAGGALFEQAQEEARTVMRARRHITGSREEDFFIGTAQSYIALWESISSAFFTVFVMVSSISAVVGGIVIMNVMLVSVTERTKEIGIRRAVGASRRDVLRQFLTESVIQCLVGGMIGIAIGFLAAYALRRATDFPALVQGWVALLGVVLSSAIGLFFGIYPATRAAELDPVEALRSE